MIPSCQRSSLPQRLGSEYDSGNHDKDDGVEDDPQDDRDVEGGIGVGNSHKASGRVRILGMLCTFSKDVGTFLMIYDNNINISI